MDADFLDTARLHSAKKATIMSACLPGLGQAYNRKFWKIPVIYGSFGACTYFYILNKNEEQRYRTLAAENKLRINPPYDQQQLERGIEYFQRNKELNIILMFGIYFLNIIDATVDGYLFDFDVSKDLSLHFSPTMFNPVSVGVTCNFYFK